MAVFNPITITENGKDMLTQALAGQGTLTFVAVSTSTSTPSNPEDLTALTGIKQTTTPASAILDGNVIQVSALFSNSDLTQGYTANSLGLYAKLGDGAQTLFAVVTATEPDVFPAQNAQSPSSFLYQFNISISDTSQLTVTVPEDGSLPASVFNQMFPGITAPGQNNDGDALVYNASSGAWGYVNTETVFTTVSESGEFVSLQKTLADDFKQIQLFGKSVQKPTTGAQLFNVNVCKNETDLQYKITIDDYATGKITVSIDNPEGSVVMPVNRLSDYCPTMVAGKTYYLSGKHDGSNGDISLVDVSDTWSFGTSREIKEQDLQSAVQFGFGTYSNIMIVEGSTKKPYEVYTGGEAATEPTPEFPLPITSAGNYNAESEKYEIGIGVDGVNLLDYESWKGTDIVRGTGQYINNGVVLTASETDCFTEYTLPDVYKIPVLPSTTYVLSWECSGGYGLVYVFENSKLSEQYPINSYTGNSKNKLVFTTGNNANYIKFRVGVLTAGETATYKNIQLNVGDTPLEFKPFQGTQQKQLQIPNPLRGIPVDSGGNYTDSEGQQWLCDYIDRERGKYVQCVQEIVSNNSENWDRQTPSHSKIINFFYALRDKIGKPVNVFCNIAKYKKEIIVGADNDNVSNVCKISNNGVNFLIDFALSTFPTAFDFYDFISKKPIIIYYLLETPIETDLTPDQIAALNLSTYQGITNIGTDTMPQVGMAVESRGFNLAGDLAQNLIDLQTTVQTQTKEIEALQSTVQSQGTAIVANTTKLVKMGLIDYSNNTSAQNSNSLSVLDSSNKNLLAANATYLVYISTKISEGSPTERSYLPTLEIIYSDSDDALVEGTPVYLAQARTQTPFGCTFMFRTNSTLPESINFYIDDDTHQFLGSTSVIYRID